MVDKEHKVFGKTISDKMEKIFYIPEYNTEILDEPSSSGSEDPDDTTAMQVATNMLAKAYSNSTVKQQSTVDSGHSTGISQGGAHIALDMPCESENRTDEQDGLLKQETDTMDVDPVKAKESASSLALVPPMRRFEKNDPDPVKTVKMAVPIGIDLGTTNSCVAVYMNGRTKIIPDEDGHRIIPSCVAFTDKGCLFGHNAKMRLTVNPSNTVYDAKRLIGRTYDDPNVQNDMKFWSFRVVASDGKPMIQVRNDEKGDDLFAAENISGMVLNNLKEMAKRFLNQDVKQAVITVPAHFNDSQRRATRDAAQYAGLEVLRIINEPTAAAMAYGFDKFKVEEHTCTIMVYDLGGGTFDVSILTIEGGTFVVKATGGDTHLGGADFDNRLATYLLNRYHKIFDPDEELSTNSFQRLVRNCELAKCWLSEKEYANMFIDDFHEGHEFHKELYRDEFDKCNIDLFNKTLQIVQLVLDDAGMTVEDINDIVLVGGSTRIPKIQEKLSKFFNGKELVRNDSINPDEVVAVGAAIQAAALMETPPDEFDDLLLMDVTALTLGIESKGNIFLPIIDRNSLIPARSTKTVTTMKDNQTVVDLGIYQGERELAKENHFLGDFYLDGIPPAVQGVPQIDVTFELDVNGILDVTAKDKDTGKQRNIQIDYNKARMSEEHIELMLETAERFKHEDREEKERIQARNNLQSFVDWIIHLMQNYAEKLKIPPARQENMLAKAENEKQWLIQNIGNPKAEYLWRYDLLLAQCQSVPDQHLVPGNLPGQPSKRGERNWAVASYDITGINQSVDSGNGNESDSEIGDID